MRVLFITNIPSPYRVDFFNEMGKYCDLTVVFERKCAKDREDSWQSYHFEQFRGIFLRGLNLGVDSSFCPCIIRYLKEKYDRVVFGGYSSPTCMIGMEYLRLRHIPFWLNADGGFIKDDGLMTGMLKHHLIGGADAWLSTGELTTRYL